ncbi:MAG: cytochrome [Caulobacter sp.]|nr:cytochrome [Caulobacter sp.]
MISLRFPAVLLAAALAVGASTVQAATPPQALFMDNCSACHQPTGKGVTGAFPALAGNPFVQGDPALVSVTVLNGRGGMPAFKDDLTDADLAAVLTYVRSAWGNKAKPVTVAQVRAARVKANAMAKARGLQIH